MKGAILHSHTEYSVRDSLIKVDEYPRIAAEKGWGACAITDHGAIEGIPAFLKACAKVGIKPLTGCELYVTCPDTYDLSKRKGNKLQHLTVLAKNAKGFSSLLRLVSIGHRDHYDTRRQKAAIPLKLVLEELEDCIVMSGCYSGPFWRDTEAAMGDLVDFMGRFKDDFYLEVQPLHDWNEQVVRNKMIAGIARDLNLKTVVTPDCHFFEKTDGIFHNALLAIADHKSIFDPTVWKFSTKLSYAATPNEALEGLGLAGFSGSDAVRALETTWEVAEKVSPWTWSDLPQPRFPVVQGDMKAIVEKAFDDKGLASRPEYKERLDKEIAVFSRAGLDQYLLLVRHCINLFKNEGAELGPRGSVGGSLVAYLMGISPLDPLVHGLSFERFYAPGRKGWPDVDLDLDMTTRERASDILRREFGSDKVAQISNFATYKLRLAIKDAARAYGIRLADDSTFNEDEKDAKDIEDIPPGKELLKANPDAAHFARMLVGRVRHFGAHAGGFVISADPLYGGRSAVVSRGKDKALAWDMEVAEELGFIKLDFLGLDTLSAIKAVGKETNIDWVKVPLDDEPVYRDFSDGLTAGVPQFLSAGMRSFIRNLKPTKFEDLVWANAAFRPGGLGQMSPEELAQKYKTDPSSIIVYQEDVMDICVRIAGFTWTEADSVRKIIAKSKGIEELEKWHEKFINGCSSNGGWLIPDAEDLWSALVGFARYAFCKAHATSYSWNSYRIAYAKRHHPTSAFLALLRSEENRQPIIDEAVKFGVKILPPDPNRSGLDWAIEDDSIRMPLQMADGMDLRLAKTVIAKRAKTPYKDAADLVSRLYNYKGEAYKYPESMPSNLFSGKMPGYNFVLPAFSPRGMFLKKELDAFIVKERGCTLCRLGGYSKKVPIDFGGSNVMVVGEAPGRDEVRRGRPFVGASGQLVDGALAKYGVSGKRLSWSNTCHCMPPKSKNGLPAAMTSDEIEPLLIGCPLLEEELAMLKPPLILAVGKRAWTRLGGEGTITKANGNVIEVAGTKIVACLHPAFVLRDISRRPDFDAAIEKFCDLYRSLFPDEQPSDERRVPDEIPMWVRARQLLDD